jgi:hypothetical protein
MKSFFLSMYVACNICFFFICFLVLRCIDIEGSVCPLRYVIFLGTPSSNENMSFRTRFGQTKPQASITITLLSLETSKLYV